LGAISDRSVTDLDKIKAELNVNGTADDGVLEDMLGEAKDLADAWCDNPFVNANGKKLPIPSRVERWIKGTVARWYQQPENGKTSETVVGVGASQFGPVDYTGLPWRPSV
jgi:hypothetical protein